MFMPIADPSISLDENTEIAKRQNGALMKFPEVEYVVAKVARAETSTDPAPSRITSLARRARGAIEELRFLPYAPVHSRAAPPDGYEVSSGPQSTPADKGSLLAPRTSCPVIGAKLRYAFFK
jgi:hypothetical protein